MRTNVTTGDAAAITALFQDGPPQPGTPVTVIAGAAGAALTTKAGETTKVCTLPSLVPVSFVSDGTQLYVKGAIAVNYILPT